MLVDNLSSVQELAAQDDASPGNHNIHQLQHTLRTMQSACEIGMNTTENLLMASRYNPTTILDTLCLPLLCLSVPVSLSVCLSVPVSLMSLMLMRVMLMRLATSRPRVNAPIACVCPDCQASIHAMRASAM